MMTNKYIRVWDPLVRLFHWSLVLCFIVAWLTGEEGDLLHIYSGYAVMGLVLLRVVWGLIGTRYARFSNFLYSPKRTIRYLRGLLGGQPEHYTGHNPAGGWMIMLLLVSLLITGYTGLEVYGAEGYGPLGIGGTGIEMQTDDRLAAYEYDDDDAHEGDAHMHHAAHEHEESAAEEFWEEVHEFFAYLTLLLVFVHVAGVIVASRMHGENLVRSMITGTKHAPEV